jgi:hypothetical protein
MEPTNNNGVLNLDEMLGDKKLIVKIQGRDYPIRTVKSLTPGEFGKVMAYGTKFSSLTEDDMTLNDGATVMQAIDDVIEIIAPSLPRYKPTLRERFQRGYKRRFSISMQEATAIMQFWTEQNRQAKNARGAVMPVRKTRR